MDLEVGFSTTENAAQYEGGIEAPTGSTLLEMPCIVQRVGEVLSAPDGTPTRVYTGALIYLSAYPVFVAMIGWRRSLPSITIYYVISMYC